MNAAQFDWYQSFNTLEALLWWAVASFLYLKVPRQTAQQAFAVKLGVLAFFAFGVTDFLEARTRGAIPLWLWAFKCLCGASILAARFTWRGWSQFRWTDREFLFGVGCLIAVFVLIILQSTLS